MPRSSERVLDQARDAVGDELVERLDVVRDPADDHAGPVALVVAEREPCEVGEELVPQVGEHALARPAGEVRVRGREREGEDRRSRGRGATIQVSRSRSCALMPSSIASFARYGGASATSVYARSVTSARVVRPLYGSVSRARTPMRRRVRRHDQSRTSPPRSSERWPPGCQTFTRSPSGGPGAARARGSPGTPRSSRAARPASRGRRCGRGRGRRPRRRARSSRAGAR